MLEMRQTGEEIGYQLITIRKVIDQLELNFSKLAADFVKTDFWEEQGSASPYDWVRFNCHMTSNAAGDRVAVGELASNLPESIQAMDDGKIGFAHLTVMARTANAVGQAFEETKLLKLAHENSPGKFHYKCLHYRHSVSPKKYSDEQAALVHSNFLYMNRGDDGSFVLTGSLDPVGGAVVRNALEPLARYSGKDDHRLRPQRMADALIGLAGHKTKIQMQVTSSIETLLDLTGAPGAETEHCQWPGCERTAPNCDGHHLVYVMHGGSDELENLILLCTRHHRMVHEAGWQLVKTESGEIVTIAPTVTFGLPRGPD
ncbi:MAG: DUF222 domain-containing protein [Chloroflexi bacterium]|nr:MAG: DUF222 domain-containing protein [Chloroflexota bacterium]